MRLPSPDILRIEADSPQSHWSGEFSATVRNARGWPISRTAPSTGQAVLQALQGYDHATRSEHCASAYCPRGLGNHLDSVAYHAAELSARAHELLEDEADVAFRWADYPNLQHGVGFAYDPICFVFACLYDLCDHAVKLHALQLAMTASPPSKNWRNHRLWIQAMDSLQWAMGFAAHVAANMGCSNLITGDDIECHWTFAFDPRGVPRDTWVASQVDSWKTYSAHRVQHFYNALVHLQQDAQAQEVRITEMLRIVQDGLGTLADERR